MCSGLYPIEVLGRASYPEACIALEIQLNVLGHPLTTTGPSIGGLYMALLWGASCRFNPVVFPALPLYVRVNGNQSMAIAREERKE